VPRRALACLAAGLLAACAPGAVEITSVRFAPAHLPRGVARSNLDLADDFLELTFALESGEEVSGLLRYERPVRVYLHSDGLAVYRDDLEALLARLRDEAGIDIAETVDPEAAQIRIEAVPAAQITRVFPSAACFIVPGETDWASFMRRRSGTRLRWSDQATLERAAIFLPLDTTPQDVRDCLHEEITQALGPANDLYRLPDSIWNDDNFHGIATPFDMLILRALYQPELQSGMSRDEVAAALPRVLGRENPAGRGVPRRPRYPESRAWGGAIEAALARSAPRGERQGAAAAATRIAADMRPQDHRLGVALLTLGRLELRRDPAAAAHEFAEAYALFREQMGPDDLRTAQAGVHLAALALGAGELAAAVALADRHLPTALAAQNAILISGLLAIKAEALAELGEAAAAQQARLDSLRWARYGFGDTDGALAREQAQLAALMRLENE
jgi:hypothetical protein